MDDEVDCSVRLDDPPREQLQFVGVESGKPSLPDRI